MTPATRGHLIALDGGHAGLTAAAIEVVHALAVADIPRGVSAWDASGVFTELSAATGGVRRPSARTLTLLYAADLAFRLRWQIGPALEERRYVIAAPYVETAKALGVAAGLSRRWLDELFRFAPRADSSYLVTAERTSVDAVSTSYFDCFSTTMQGSHRAMHPVVLRNRSLSYLSSLEKRRRVQRLTEHIVSGLGRSSGSA